MQDKNLIIIASQPRSGSTMLQALISNNEMVGTVSEPWLLLPFLSYNRQDLIDSVYSQELALIGINEFKKNTQSNKLDHELAKFLLSQYSDVLNNGEEYVLDKTPRYYEILNEIIQYFPNCKIIILKRHPFAVLNSIIKTWNVKTNNDLLQYKRDILNAPFLLQKFAKSNKSNKNVFEMKYEDLVKDPMVITRELYNWLNLPFSENILEYGNNKKYLGFMGDPTGVKKHKSPNESSLNNWKSSISDPYWSNFLKGYHHFLTPEFLMEYGGYSDDEFKQAAPTKMFDEFYERASWPFLRQKIPMLKFIKYRFLKKFNSIKF